MEKLANGLFLPDLNYATTAMHTYSISAVGMIMKSGMDVIYIKKRVNLVHT